MKEITKEFAKDCGHVTVELAKYLGTGTVISAGSYSVSFSALAAVYALACTALKCTPEGRALDIAGKVIGYGGLIGGTALSFYLDYKLDIGKGVRDAIEDMPTKYSKDSTIPNKFKFEVVIPQ